MHALKVITVTLYFLLLVQSQASRREPSARLFIWCAYVVVRPAVAAMQWLQYTRYFIHVVMPVASSLAFEREQGKGHLLGHSGQRALYSHPGIAGSRSLSPARVSRSRALLARPHLSPREFDVRRKYENRILTEKNTKSQKLHVQMRMRSIQNVRHYQRMIPRAKTDCISHRLSSVVSVFAQMNTTCSY
jgi:hypothetical protein